MASSDKSSGLREGDKVKYSHFNGEFSAWTGTAGVGFSWIQQQSSKQEDRILLRCEPFEDICDAVAAIFDGHNSSAASEHASKNFLTALSHQCGLLLATAEFESQSPILGRIRSVTARLRPQKTVWPRYLDSAIIKTFKKLDSEIKQHGDSGTTATVVLFKKDHKGGINAKVCWVGDSRAIMFTDSGVEDLTKDHRLANTAELSRIGVHYGMHNTEDKISSNTLVRISGKLYAKPQPIRVREEDLVRPLSTREDMTPEARTPVMDFEESGDSSACFQIDKQPGYKHTKSFVGIFTDEQGHAVSSVPRVFAGETRRSVQNTRSLGDRGAASAVIAHPEITDVLLPPSARIVIASDGVWDVMTSHNCWSMLQRTPSTSEAANRLLKKTLANYVGVARVDDISIILIDCGFEENLRLRAEFLGGK
ncbi:hypothetical protein CYMTET_50479 [Cymbomonas tetramitiformis]|uniref:PPM-type phosphatase domain-containing protein n=1 Tax=Cymbomonas tetramitiformis TaxID=36881 RepID=A0AAE0EUQ3_9CHLO|nr:hypothetical protein CYMTET_50479 [Cymbomonas tetramitiformis]